MNNDRRTFLKQASISLAATSISASNIAVAAQENTSVDTADPRRSQIPLTHQGSKIVVRDKKAVASSQHPIVTNTMLEILRSGGNAADAAVGGAITQTTVQLDVTNHTGTVAFLYWE